MDRDTLERVRRKGSGLPAFAVIASVAVAFMMIPVGYNQAASNMVLGRVDIGAADKYTGDDPSGYWSMDGWGPVEPSHSGGNYGGIADEDPAGDCRTTWSYCYDKEDSPSAKLTIPMPGGYSGSIQCIKMRVLDGVADDSFKVWVYDPCDLIWVEMFTYVADVDVADDGDPDENWVVHTIWLVAQDEYGDWYCLVPHGAPVYRSEGFQIMIELTNPSATWDIALYGQLAVDWVELFGNGIVK